MGLTIHYTLKTTEQDADKAAMLVHKMRQLALDLPFDEVGPIVDLAGADCDFEARRSELKNGDEKNESLFWLLIQAGGGVDCPWNKSISRRILPSRIIAFDTYPGPGSESANFGLCLYPAEIEWEYTPEDDGRFWDMPEEWSARILVGQVGQARQPQSAALQVPVSRHVCANSQGADQIGWMAMGFILQDPIRQRIWNSQLLAVPHFGRHIA